MRLPDQITLIRMGTPVPWRRQQPTADGLTFLEDCVDLVDWDRYDPAAEDFGFSTSLSVDGSIYRHFSAFGWSLVLIWWGD